MSDCCDGGGNILLLACSGGSNVGQIANEAAKALDRLGQGRMGCAIGVGAQLPKFVEAARDSVCVALDGCPTACVAQALRNAGVEPALSVVVTELGIEKAHNFDFTLDQVAEVAGAVAAELEALTGGAGECGCGCGCEA